MPDEPGGNLVLGALVQLRDEVDTAPNAAVLCSPLIDLVGEGKWPFKKVRPTASQLHSEGPGKSMTSRAHLDPLPAAVLVESMGGAYLGGKEPKATPLASLLYADFNELSPLRVLVETDEGLHDDSIRLDEKVRSAAARSSSRLAKKWSTSGRSSTSSPRPRLLLSIGEFLRKNLRAASALRNNSRALSLGISDERQRLSSQWSRTSLKESRWGLRGVSRRTCRPVARRSRASSPLQLRWLHQRLAVPLH